MCYWGATGVLYRGVTGVLQMRYRVVTGVLKIFYRGDTELVQVFYMGQTRQEVKRPKKCFLLFIFKLKMVLIQQIRRRHQFKTFVRSVALVELD